MQAEKLNFRQNPTFADCFPSSEKCYKDVDHEETKLRVRETAILADGQSSRGACFNHVLLLQVPFRRVHLQESNGHVDLYDTSGEQVMPVQI